MSNYQEITNGIMFSFAVYGLILFIDDVRAIIKYKFLKKNPNLNNKQFEEEIMNETNSDTSDDSIVLVPYTEFPEKNEDGYSTQPSDSEENFQDPPVGIPEPLLHKRRRTE